jgi:hypothetical protein
MSTTIRRAGSDDRASLLRLFSTVFGEPDPGPLWAWKYDHNPHDAACIVAVQEGEAVGFFGILATRYRGAGIDAPGGSVVDTMTSPSARGLGRGVYREMAAAYVAENRAMGLPFVFGFPHERARVVGEKLIGYRMVEPAGSWTRTRSAPGLLRRLRRRLLRVRSERDFSPRHDELAEIIHSRPGIRTDRSRKTLDWRFGLHPRHSYRRFELLGPRGGSLAYAVVLQVGERALVVDLEARDDGEGPVADLLESVGEACSLSGAPHLEVRAARSTGLGPRLAALGFAESPPDTWLEVMPVAEGFPAVEAGGTFDYRYADHDIF